MVRPRYCVKKNILLCLTCYVIVACASLFFSPPRVSDRVNANPLVKAVAPKAKPLGFLYPYTDSKKIISKKKLKEPSGIVYHRLRKTLFVLGDEGQLAEFTTRGRRLRTHQFEKIKDLEAITVDPRTGLLYVADERHDQIIEIDPQTFLITRRFSVPLFFKGKAYMQKGGDGIEGLTFVPDVKHKQGGIFYFTNQAKTRKPNDLSAVIAMVLPLKVKQQPEIVGYYPQPITDLSGMFYDHQSKHLFLASDFNNLLLEMTLDGVILKALTLPGNAQEGIALDEKDQLYIAQDTGGVLRLKTKKFPRTLKNRSEK